MCVSSYINNGQIQPSINCICNVLPSFIFYSRQKIYFYFLLSYFTIYPGSKVKIFNHFIYFECLIPHTDIYLNVNYARDVLILDVNYKEITLFQPEIFLVLLSDYENCFQYFVRDPGRNEIAVLFLLPPVQPHSWSTESYCRGNSRCQPSRGWESADKDKLWFPQGQHVYDTPLVSIPLWLQPQSVCLPFQLMFLFYIQHLYVYIWPPQINHKYPERRLLVAEACGALAPYLPVSLNWAQSSNEDYVVLLVSFVFFKTLTSSLLFSEGNP